MTSPASPKAPAATSTASLLYWLLVVCGLAGLTLMRLDTPSDLLPLWAGSLAGVALGQLLAWARVRAWLIAVMAMGGFWFAPVAIFVLFQSFGTEVTTALFAFVPAALCGYLSLSERAGLIAFWYPAVLWMLVILDGPVPGAFDTRTSLPFLVGLAGLFVAFLRARETRRVAVWRAQGTDRIAPALPRTVLRSSPLRAASQYAWTGAVGAVALVLAAWVAPHLWQKEQAKHASTMAAQHASAVEAAERGDEPPCCPDTTTDVNHSRVSEYFPLVSGEEERRRAKAAASCKVCRDDSFGPMASESNSGAGTGSGAPGLFDSDPSKGPTADTNPTTAPTPTPTPTPTVEPTSQPKAPTAQVGPATTKSRRAKGGGPGRPAVVVFVSKPAPPVDTGGPWQLALSLSLAGLGLHVLVRAVRRQLTLRHLARPFWNETLDQRISNHWQRMLIGLRDAGIIPKTGEQPIALAERVGIEGMETCATILERVRHGVRVDDTDLEAMNSAAGAVYGAARERAGVTGRAAAMLRWPLA